MIYTIPNEGNLYTVPVPFGPRPLYPNTYGYKLYNSPSYGAEGRRSNIDANMRAYDMYFEYMLNRE